MATLILQAVGSAIAGPIGAAIGAIAGTVIDRALIGGPSVKREGPRLTDLTVQNSSFGEALPLVYGTVRLAGNIIWSSGLIERRSDQTQGGGKSGSVTTTTYSYFAHFAVALVGHKIEDIKRIWADGKLLRTADGTLLPGGQLRLYTGDEDQMPDSLIEAAVGLTYAPAHRGMAYAMFEDLPLADYANRIPNLTFEVQAGSAAVANLSHIFEDILHRCALRQRNVAPDLAEVPGFMVARESSARAVLEALAPLRPIALSDVGGAVQISPALQSTATCTLNADRLGAATGAAEDSTADERRLAPAATLAGEVQLRFSDPQRDYQSNVQRARRFFPRSDARQTIDMPAVLSADRAKQLAEQILARAWRERQQRQLRLDLTHLALRPGATICFSDAAQNYWLVQAVALEAGGLTVTLVPLSSADAQSVAVADGGGAIGQTPAPHGATTGALLDVPPVETVLPTTPRLLAVAAGASSGWRRASLWLSTDQGQSYALSANVTRSTVLGTTKTSLAATAAGIWDEVSRVDVELVRADMTLLSRPEAAILAGSNLALIGEELLQFRSATAVSPQRYRLSGLLRGVRGTEAAIVGHGPDEPFILLDPLPDVSLWPPLGALDQTLRYKWLSPGQVLGDVPAQLLNFRAKALRPLAPVHGSAQLLAGGDWHVRWVRRSRSGFDWLDGIDAPLAEVSLAFRLTVYVGGVVKRTVDVVDSSWTYAAALQSADGVVAGTGTLEIAQLSASVGAGDALVLTF
jgi:hypothetical protein